MIGEEVDNKPLSSSSSTTTEDTLSANEENEEEDGDVRERKSDNCSLRECDSNLLGKILMFLYLEIKKDQRNLVT